MREPFSAWFSRRWPQTCFDRFDPLTYIATSGITVFVALAASYLPARRASRIDPLVALRE